MARLKDKAHKKKKKTAKRACEIMARDHTHVNVFDQNIADITCNIFLYIMFISIPYSKI